MLFFSKWNLHSYPLYPLFTCCSNQKLRHPLWGLRCGLETTRLVLIFPCQDHLWPGSQDPQRDLVENWKYSFVGQNLSGPGMRPVLSFCPLEFKRMGQFFLLLTCVSGWTLKILSSALLEQEWMGAVQPSKLLFLFMITFLSEGNCWCLLFRCSRLVRKGMATCDERYWTEPRYFNKSNP